MKQNIAAILAIMCICIVLWSAAIGASLNPIVTISFVEKNVTSWYTCYKITSNQGKFEVTHYKPKEYVRPKETTISIIINQKGERILLSDWVVKLQLPDSIKTNPYSY